jgi:hypothetical protein
LARYHNAEYLAARPNYEQLLTEVTDPEKIEAMHAGKTTRTCTICNKEFANN